MVIRATVYSNITTPACWNPLFPVHTDPVCTRHALNWICLPFRGLANYTASVYARQQNGDYSCPGPPAVIPHYKFMSHLSDFLPLYSIDLL